MAPSQPLPNPQITIDKDYRRLLDLENGDDSATSLDELSDDLLSVNKSVSDGSNSDDVIGISISRVQTRMKSPRTPAFIKERAINDSADYFAIDSQLVQDASEVSSIPAATEGQLHRIATEAISPFDNNQSPIVSPWAAQGSAHQRSAYSRLALGEATGPGRHRSSSGPSIFGRLSKLLPNVPSIELTKTSEVIDDNTAPCTSSNDLSSDPTTSSYSWSSEPPLTGPDSEHTSQANLDSVDDKTLLQPPSTGLDGNVESLISPLSLSKTKSRPRSNSETSLYLRRKPTGMSAFDDTSAYAEISDMANSRFKAITDSLQNSTIRLPRIRTIKHSPKHDKDNLSGENDRVTKQNTKQNAKITSQQNDYQYTSIKKMRDNKKHKDGENSHHRAHPILNKAMEELTGDVVVMGGYRGSILRSAKPPHRQLWAPVKVGLNLRSVDLEVGLTREDEEKMEDTIFSSGVLSHIGPIDICRRLLKHFKKCPNARQNGLRVHDWGYDWRLSPDMLSKKFITYLESLECNHPETPHEQKGATVIAHSLGGLVTRHAINQRPDLFAGVIYAGTPQNCVNILGPMRNGDDVLLSSRVLTAQVNFTLRTSYALLPENGRCFLNNHSNERYDLDFFDPKTWDEYRLSPCINSPLPREVAEGEQKKGIISSISSSISSSLTSIPGRRSSMFGGGRRDSSPASSNPDSRSDSRDVAKDAALSAAQNAERINNRLNSPEGNANQSLEPTMRQTTHKPSIATTCTIPRDKADEYLSRTLREVRQFKEELAFIPALQEQNLYPPHGLIYGKTVPTVFGARVASREAIKYEDAFDDLAFAAGDGVVLASAAQLPEGYRCVKDGRVETDRGHVGLLGDLEGVGKCLSAIIEARKKGIGLGEEYIHSNGRERGRQGNTHSKNYGGCLMTREKM